MKIHPILFLSLGFLFLTSCVSSRKYEDLAASKSRLEREYDDLKKVRDEKRDLEIAHNKLQDDLALSKQEIQRQHAVIHSLEQGRDDLTVRLNDLIAQNQALLSASSSEKQLLVEEILAKEAEINRRALTQDSLAKALTIREQSFKGVEAELANKEQRIDELNKLLKDREVALSNLRSGLLNALKGYSAADLSVREENGRVYVSLSQNLLFPTGSDKVDPKGVTALQQLAGVLKLQKDIEILVEGHTDTDGSAEFNWDLSTSRATSVVKILTKEGVDPKMVTAAGRAFYLPIAPNDSADGKAKNRRVEIILAPQLEKILQMIGS
ncbi:MAG: OmpA family protein [Saprospiraceae bacterium]|nr:OmpA family protein [Saprospiraceae bacterium]